LAVVVTAQLAPIVVSGVVEQGTGKLNGTSVTVPGCGQPSQRPFRRSVIRSDTLAWSSPV
jgi:hypothetical protein